MRLVLGILGTVLAFIPSSALAQASPYPDPPPRFFLEADVAGLVEANAARRIFERRFLLSGEIASSQALYPAPSRPGFPVHLGGGVLLHRRLGVGIAYNRQTTSDATGTVIVIPHPTFMNAFATAQGDSPGLDRRESSVNLFVALFPVRNTRVELRLVGGPSWFTYDATMISTVTYSQTFNPSTPANAITITGFETADVSGRRLGLHVGGDLTYLVNSAVGITGGARFGTAMIAIDREPLSGVDQEFRIGGTTVFAGVSLRFGGRLPRS